MTRVHMGKILHSRDYHNHAVLASAVGHLSALVETLTKVGR